MKKQRLHETIRELRAELEKSESVNDPARKRIQGMLDEIDALIEEHGEVPAHRHRQLLEQLKESAGHFEESHPSLASALGRVMDALSAIGI